MCWSMLSSRDAPAGSRKGYRWTWLLCMTDLRLQSSWRGRPEGGRGLQFGAAGDQACRLLDLTVLACHDETLEICCEWEKILSYMLTMLHLQHGTSLQAWRGALPEQACNHGHKLVSQETIGTARQVHLNVLFGRLAMSECCLSVAVGTDRLQLGHILRQGHELQDG